MMLPYKAWNQTASQPTLFRVALDWPEMSTRSRTQAFHIHRNLPGLTNLQPCARPTTGFFGASTVVGRCHWAAIRTLTRSHRFPRLSGSSPKALRCCHVDPWRMTCYVHSSLLPTTFCPSSTNPPFKGDTRAYGYRVRLPDQWALMRGSKTAFSCRHSTSVLRLDPCSVSWLQMRIANQPVTNTIRDPERSQISTFVIILLCRRSDSNLSQVCIYRPRLTPPAVGTSWVWLSDSRKILGCTKIRLATHSLTAWKWR
jgi:hypothetical protein